MENQIIQCEQQNTSGENTCNEINKSKFMQSMYDKEFCKVYRKDQDDNYIYSVGNEELTNKEKYETKKVS